MLFIYYVLILSTLQLIGILIITVIIIIVINYTNVTDTLSCFIRWFTAICLYDSRSGTSRPTTLAASSHFRIWTFNSKRGSCSNSFTCSGVNGPPLINYVKKKVIQCINASINLSYVLLLYSFLFHMIFLSL